MFCFVLALANPTAICIDQYKSREVLDRYHYCLSDPKFKKKEGSEKKEGVYKQKPVEISLLRNMKKNRAKKTSF